jgi:ferrous iron transport protein B
VTEQKKENKIENKKEKAKDIATRVQHHNGNGSALSYSDTLDRFLAHPVFGLIFFALVMWLIFTISQIWVGPFIAGYLEALMSLIGNGVESVLTNLNVNAILIAFILEGIIGGFSAVIGFLPLIMVLFFMLYLLEDSGYMARVALLMDKYFKKIGLAGKSIIPMYVGTACAIPAIMSARTIKNERQRRMTILLTPFIPCGAKLPVIALFLGVFFTGRAYMTAIVYLLAILIIYITGKVIKNLLNVDLETVENTFLIVEMPEYKRPSILQAFLSMFDRAKAFIIKAGTIILLANALVWFFVNFDFSLTMVATDDSILAFISQPFAFLLSPIGIASWGLAAAAVLGFVAKEEVVGALAVIFAFSVSDDFEIESIAATRDALVVGAGLTSVSALAYMAFNLFTPPCFAAIGAMNTEFESKKWTAFAIFLQLSIGFLSALIIYQIGTLIVTGSFGQSALAGLIVLFIYVIGYLVLVNQAKKGKGLASID